MKTDGFSWALLIGAFSLLLCACGGPDRSDGAALRFGFVSNGVSDFWRVAECGVEAAQRELGVEALVRMPANGTAEEQKKQIEDLLARSVHGIAVSPRDPENMTALLDDVARRTLLVTHDSDAPRSQRLCYIGVDNYDAGRRCGELVREALPQGGAIVVLVGNLDQDNAKRRRQGLIDELLGRERDPSRFDAADAKLKGDRYEIRATFTDQNDVQKGKAAAQDALTRWSDIACVVGLYEYEPPLLLEAVRSADKLGEIAIVAFDENDATLQGIADGHIHGTVVQNPFEYGRRSIELLCRLAREEDPAKRRALLPEGGFVEVPARKITRENVQEFWKDLKQKTGRQ